MRVIFYKIYNKLLVLSFSRQIHCATFLLSRIQQSERERNFTLHNSYRLLTIYQSPIGSTLLYDKILVPALFSLILLFLLTSHKDSNLCTNTHTHTHTDFHHKDKLSIQFFFLPPPKTHTHTLGFSSFHVPTRFHIYITRLVLSYIDTMGK